MKKTAIYCRQSIDKKESISVETQETFCRNYINRIPHNKIIEVYCDKGYSGKNINRPAFQKLLEEVTQDKIEKVVIYKLDRVSRNMADFCNVNEIFKQHNTKFCSVSEEFDTTTATGAAMVNIAMVFAQMERENISMRVKDNYYDRIKKDGRWAGGPAPFGFKNGRTSDNKPTLVVCEEEMEVVRYCFATYAYSPNCSLGKLAKDLQSKGYQSRRKNGSWDNVTLARMLQSPVYVVADEGLKKYYQIRKANFLNDEEWDGTTSCHIVGKKSGNANVRKYTDLKEQSIYLTNFKGQIDSKTFIMVQERLEQNQQFGRSNAPSVLEELSGLIKCKKCGYAIKSYSKSTNGMPYISCYGHYSLKVCDAKFKGVKFKEIQEKVGIEIQKELDKIGMDILQEMIDKKQRESKITTYQEQMEKLIELYTLGGDSARIVHKKIEDLQQKISEIELNEFLDTRTTERLRIKDRLPLVYKRMTMDEKKSICQQLIEKILLSETGDIEIIWKI